LWRCGYYSIPKGWHFFKRFVHETSQKVELEEKGIKKILSLEGDFLTDQLSLRVSDELEGETYYGVCYYKGIHRRIDFKVSCRQNSLIFKHK